MKWVEPALSVLTISSISVSSPTPLVSTVGGTLPVATPAGTPAGTPAASGPKPMLLGVNLGGPSWWSFERTFMNLAAGDGRQLITTANQFVNVPADRLDGNYDVVVLAAKESIARPLNLPNKALRGQSVEIICRWNGTSPKITIAGTTVKNVKMSKNSATFTWVPKALENASFFYTGTDAKDPIRNLDCRETDASPTAVFHPSFIENMRHYSTVRMMTWSQGTLFNGAVTWKTRNKPGSAVLPIADGAPIEYQIQLANEAQVDPWFTIPWNADDEYVRKMAEMVRDKLDPKLKAHVELSNEVWNYLFKVTAQAQSEGLAAGLSTNNFEAALRRYAQKTGQVMDVWTDVFAGQTSRLVRIAAVQNQAWAAETVIGFRDTAKKVDALASAPYFGNDKAVPAGGLTTPAQRDAYFAHLSSEMDSTLKIAQSIRVLAAKYNVRYVTYEAGQHVVSADVAGNKLLQRDPRMGKLYTRYLNAWQKDFGDLLMLYQDVGPVSQYGAWGMQEYADQPLSEAPKASAMDLFRKSYLARK